MIKLPGSEPNTPGYKGGHEIGCKALFFAGLGLFLLGFGLTFRAEGLGFRGLRFRFTGIEIYSCEVRPAVSLVLGLAIELMH